VCAFKCIDFSPRDFIVITRLSVLFFSGCCCLSMINICISVALQGPSLLEKVGGLHTFMKWKHALLTVSSSIRTCKCSFNVIVEC